MERVIRGSESNAPSEYIDYLLIKKLYHCTPSELEKEDSKTIELHLGFMNLETKEANLQGQRQKQLQKLRK